MDETDVALCRLLIFNSRMPYSELAKAVGISVQSAHRRVQDLIASGVIFGFNAAFSARAYRSTWVLVHGRSEAASVNRVLESLNGEKEMDMAMVASGKYLYIGGAVVDPGRINRFTSSVAKTAKLVRPTVGIVYNPGLMDVDDTALIYPMDVKIVEALRGDSRRPVTEVAKELGVAPRTVNRHIERLLKGNLVHFAIGWYPQQSGDVVSAIHLRVRAGADREKVAAALVRRLSMREIITYSFSDRPDAIICMTWSPSIRALNELVAGLEEDRVYEEVVPNIIMDARYYEGIKGTTPPLAHRASV
ncbi:MAG: Lrp/AsnC family transcriptional regulator [Methanomassiliicoccus sp.]|nr:Lrp/AsnC family transcriptional regulator [Methanomassiliicoccus sp.]